MQILLSKKTGEGGQKLPILRRHSLWTAPYIVVRLVLKTIYVLNKKILQFFGQKSAVYNQERLSRVGYNVLYGINRILADSAKSTISESALSVV